MTGLQTLIRHLQRTYGARYQPCPAQDEDAPLLQFCIQDIPATISVLFAAREPGDFYVQLESRPAGEYLYTTISSISGLVELIDRLPR